uniref:Chitin-binding type-2 domain-containing protein n=1 Tax=Glossina brevipalpis TaxID=37001 RepID=A0A1A9W683_9MUSC
MVLTMKWNNLIFVLVLAGFASGMTLPDSESASLGVAAEVVAAENDDYTVLEKLDESLVHAENFNEHLTLQEALEDYDVEKVELVEALTETENDEFGLDVNVSEVNVVEVNSGDDEPSEASVSEVNSANEEVNEGSVVEVNSNNDEAFEASVVEETSVNEEVSEDNVVEVNSNNAEASEASVPEVNSVTEEVNEENSGNNEDNVVEENSGNEEAPTGDDNDENENETETEAEAENNNQQEEDSVSDVNGQPELEETTTVGVDTTTELPACSTPGLQAHETDCGLYYSCSAVADGTLRLQTLSCGKDEAFNAAWGRCARDISSCPNDFACLAPGTFEDPLSNTSYYLCYKRLTLDGYLLYHVNCGSGEIYLPEIGKCFIDLSDFENAYLNYDWLQVHDIDVVKLEIEQYKAEAKLQMKLEKEKLKMEKKLQKELEKMAKKKAKEEAKALKLALL